MTARYAIIRPKLFRTTPIFCIFDANSSFAMSFRKSFILFVRNRGTGLFIRRRPNDDWSHVCCNGCFVCDVCWRGCLFQNEETKVHRSPSSRPRTQRWRQPRWLGVQHWKRWQRRQCWQHAKRSQCCLRRQHSVGDGGLSPQQVLVRGTAAPAPAPAPTMAVTDQLVMCAFRSDFIGKRFRCDAIAHPLLCIRQNMNMHIQSFLELTWRQAEVHGKAVHSSDPRFCSILSIEID